MPIFLLKAEPEERTHHVDDTVIPDLRPQDKAIVQRKSTTLMNYLHFASQDDGQSLSETSGYMPRLMGEKPNRRKGRTMLMTQSYRICGHRTKRLFNESRSI
jgi:hypothetical protein